MKTHLAWASAALTAMGIAACSPPTPASAPAQKMTREEALAAGLAGPAASAASAGTTMSSGNAASASSRSPSAAGS